MLAFVGISGLAVLGAAAALLAFAEIGSAFDRVTGERMPALFAALELSRQAERISSAAPLVFVDKTEGEQMRTDNKIRRELAELEKVFAEVKRGQPDREFASGNRKLRSLDQTKSRSTPEPCLSISAGRS